MHTVMNIELISQTPIVSSFYTSSCHNARSLNAQFIYSISITKWYNLRLTNCIYIFNSQRVLHFDIYDNTEISLFVYANQSIRYVRSRMHDAAFNCNMSCKLYNKFHRIDGPAIISKYFPEYLYVFYRHDKIMSTVVNNRNGQSKMINFTSKGYIFLQASYSIIIGLRNRICWKTLDFHTFQPQISCRSDIIEQHTHIGFG